MRREQLMTTQRRGSSNRRSRSPGDTPDPLIASVIRLLGPVVAAGLVLVAVPEASSSRGGIDLVLAGSLVAAGGVAWFLTRWVVGSATILAGATLGLVTVGEATTVSARSLVLGQAAAPLIAPLLALAMVRAPQAWIALLGGVAAGPARALLYDPFLDPDCTQRCLVSPVALTHDTELAAGLHRYGILVAAVALTALMARPARRWQVAVVAAAAWSLVFERATDLVLVAAAVALLVVTMEIVERIELRRRLTGLDTNAGDDGRRRGDPPTRAP